MATLPALNDPDLNSSHYRNHTFKSVMDATDTQLFYVPAQTGGLRPPTIIVSDISKVTIAVTASPISDIQEDSALWFTMESEENMLTLNSVLTAVKFTASDDVTVTIAC